MSQRPNRILPVIVLSQFAGASSWFAGNAVLSDLQQRWGFPPEMLGDITAAVQFGFVAGTLVFAFLAIADHHSPRRIFFFCCICGAVANAATYAIGENPWPLLALRFVTGFFLAGVYPVGMKIASGWYDRDLGKALGYLVGALVLGTAFPHLLRGFGQTLPWEAVVFGVSAISLLGGALMLALVPDGPYLRAGARFDPRSLAVIFRSKEFRASSFGYFGHMWELYAFWAFLPALLGAYAARAADMELNIPLWAFAVIAVGAVGCAAGGLISLRLGSARVAFVQLLASGACCLASPIFFAAPLPVFLAFLLFWGIVVAGDSPQFSALNARYAPAERVGSALTIGNCIGFGITIVSIQLLNYAIGSVGEKYLFLLLAPGPLFGLIALWPLLRVRGDSPAP